MSGSTHFFWSRLDKRTLWGWFCPQVETSKQPEDKTQGISSKMPRSTTKTATKTAAPAPKKSAPKKSIKKSPKKATAKKSPAKKATPATLQRNTTLAETVKKTEGKLRAVSRTKK
jgi:hypothetical protein